MKKQFPIAYPFYGGLDKHVPRRGRMAIDAEPGRNVPAMKASGGVPALDHRIPKGTPLDAYRYYTRRMWEMIG